MNSQQVTEGDGFTLCYSEAVMRQTAAQRFIFRVYALIEEKGLNQKDLRGHRGEGWISTKLRGSRQLKLNEAEEIATALQYPLAELLRRPDDRVYELDNLEARLVEAFRQFSKDEQAALLILATMRQRQAPYATGRKLAKGGSTSLSPGASHGRRFPAARQTAPDPLLDAMQRLVIEYDQDPTQDAGRQAAATRVDRAKLSQRDRKARGSDTASK